MYKNNLLKNINPETQSAWAGLYKIKYIYNYQEGFVPLSRIQQADFRLMKNNKG